MSGIPDPAGQPRPANRVWLKALVFLGVFGLFVLVLYATGLFHFFMDRERMGGFIRSLGAWGFVGFIAIQAFQVVAAPIPGEATGFLGGYLYGPLLGVALSTIGLTIGSYIAFTLSRTFGRPLTDRYVDPAIMSRFDYLLHHKGAFFVFLLFLLPGFPKDYLCFILGLGHLSTLEFLVIASAGRLLGTSLLTLGGAYVRHQQYRQFFVLCGLAVVVVFLVIAFRDRFEGFLRRLYERGRGRKN